MHRHHTIFAHARCTLVVVIAASAVLLQFGDLGRVAAQAPAQAPTRRLAQAAAPLVFGHTPWAVLLCKFSDQPQEPQPPSYFAQFMTDAGAGAGGLYDYWHDVSYGNIDFAGSVVKGWYTESVTLAQARTKSRYDRISDCINAASSAAVSPYTVPANYHIAVMVNAAFDAGSAGGRVILDAGSWDDLSFAAHEMGHGYGLDHSFSSGPSGCASNGEYGDAWDIMSAMCVSTRHAGAYRDGGPGLAGPYLDRLGWLPIHRVYTLGQEGTSSSAITLAALNHPEAAGYMLAKVPFDVTNPFHYYTVEFRRATGWDAGIPRDTVLIHEVRADGHSYLITDNGGPEWQPGQTFQDAAHGISIGVGSIDSASSTATVTLTGTDYCVQGYVWREATPGDHVCVTPQARAQAAADNGQAGAHRAPNGGAYGPDTCLSGYVWREATPGDHVCVTPQTRAQASADNRQAAPRRVLSGSDYGPNWCSTGYVWREATAADYVCVAPQTRAQAAADNAQAALHRAPNGGAYGPDTCLSGYVWREATLGDHVCVTPQSRAQAAADDQQALSRIATH